MLPLLSVDDVLERAIAMITAHELVQNPIVFNNAGQPIRITKVRDFDGLDTNSTGLTLSIFPYAYMGTSNETIGSHNAALVYDAYELGGRNGGADGAERCRLSLVVKLTAQGYDVAKTTIPGVHPIVVERSMNEVALYRWLTMMRLILLTNPIAVLGGLVAGSTINWGAFRSVSWDKGPGTSSKGENAVFHSATLLWQLEMFVPRDWKDFPQGLPPGSGDPLVVPWLSSWQYVGLRTADCMPIYWDSLAGWLVTLDGWPVRATPLGLKVLWKPSTQHFVREDGVTNLTTPELHQPDSDPSAPWIDTTLRYVGTLNGHRLFWNTAALHFQLCDGTVITTIDGVLITYIAPDGSTPNSNGQVGDASGHPLPDSTDFTGLHGGRVVIHDAKTGALRDHFQL